MDPPALAALWLIPSGNLERAWFRPVVPGWVVPSWWGVSDSYWLTFQAYMEGSASAGAAAATLAWVCGGVAAPITDRREQPVTEVLAHAEQEAAGSKDGVGVLRPLEVTCAELGVPYYPAQDVSTVWALKVWDTLSWLRGPQPGVGQVKPPIELPVRNARGAAATADELYEAAVTAEPWRYRHPEQRIPLRARIEGEVIRSRRLAALIDAIKRRLGVVA